MLDKVYDYLMDGLKDLYGSKLNQNLSLLRSEASSLYQALTSDKVDVNYRDKNIQIAYVLRYFPIYWQPSYRALKMIEGKALSDRYWNSDQWENWRKEQSKESKKTPQTLLSRAELRIGILGAGPAPEVIGVMNALRGSPYQIDANYQEVQFDLYDEERDWIFARDTFLPFKPNISISNYFIDLSQISKNKSFGAFTYDIFIMQNCFNEFVYKTSKDIFLNNIDYIFGHLKNNSCLIFTDRVFKGEGDHGGITATMKEIKELFSKRDDCTIFYDNKLHYGFDKSEIPITLIDYFFDEYVGASALKRMVYSCNNNYTQLILVKGNDTLKT